MKAEETHTKKRTGGSRLLRLVVLALVLFIALALGEEEVQEWFADRGERAATVRTKESVGDVVKRYNEKIIIAHDQSNPTVMTDMVTPAELRRIDTYITYNNYEKNQTLSNKLLKIKIVSVALGVEQESARVKTEETWSYRYIDKKTKRAGKSETVRYKATYVVEKQAGRWLVDEVKIDSEKKGKS